MASKPKPEQWGTRIGLILAMAGNAVGLGNFLRFPVQAVNNGGGDFIIPYLVCFLLMGIPLLWIEWTIGRFGGRYGNHSTPFILDNLSKGPWWKYIGVFGIFTNIGVAAYYCYIESWTITYVIHSITGTFSSLTAPEVEAFFGNYLQLGSSTLGIPYENIVVYVLCLGLNTYILSRGLKGGIEAVAKVGIPLLLLFGAFLAIRGLTLGVPEGVDCPDCNANLAFNFLWEPSFNSIWDLKVWLAAAGQIFFTLSVGMGTVHCYAAYVKADEDIALNGMTAGWLNGFVEAVLGASIVIPIAVGYLGLDWVKENAGFAMAFQTMPYLFHQWGDVLGMVAGFMWFGLLFFAGITSSLAMGTPWMSFMRDEFNFSTRGGAITFGLITLVMGLPTVIFFQQGVFDEYDFWAGTVSLVALAMLEVILFSWVFGAKRGYRELKRGADMRVSKLFIPVATYVTPALLLMVFLGALVTPKNNDWSRALGGVWELDANSIVGKVLHKDRLANRSWFSAEREAEAEGRVLMVAPQPSGETVVLLTPPAPDPAAATALAPTRLSFGPKDQVQVQPGQHVAVGQVLATGPSKANPIFYIDLARLILSGLFIFIALMVWVAERKRKREGRRNPRIKDLPEEA